ncbi:exopolysaccharide transport family protein [Marivita sp. GX14005]|uniref:GumC family protein n=1 Tax=Marivita sp. GX14005 TaxID=2942276 RepID=UPI0020185696|nr:exopolysaccharide transport family protein [Marivita sp. GX14005]MCL3881732.1 exopolysaccharide transport family protein [Marivita sp. GX14005]
MNRRGTFSSFMVDDPLDSTPRQGGVTFSDVYQFILRRWTLIALVFIVTIVISGAMLSKIEPRFTATAELTLVDPRQQSSPIADLLTGVPLSRQVVEQEIATMRSRSFMIEVVKRLETDGLDLAQQRGGPPAWPVRAFRTVKRYVSGLITPPPEPVQLDPQELSTDGGATATGATASGDLTESDANLATLADETVQYGPLADLLAALLQISQRGNGYVIYVTAEAKDPDIAAAIANATATEYTRFSLELRSQAIEEQVELLTGRVDELGRNLEDAETAVVDFQVRVTEANEANADQLTRQIEDLGRSLIAARTEIVEADARRGRVLELVALDGPVAASDVLESPILIDLRRQLSEYRIERSRAVEQFGEASPQASALDAVIDRVEQEAVIETDRIVRQYQTRANTARAVVASIEKELASLEEKVNARSRVTVELAKLRRIADANRIAYQEFLNAATESAQLKALQQPSVRLLSFAETPRSPSSPRTLMLLATAGLAGLTIGFGLALLLELTSNTVKTAREMRDLTGLPVIGSFSHIPRRGHSSLQTKLVQAPQLLSNREQKFIEEGRRLALFLSGIADRNRGTIVFTSAVSEERTETAAMLSAYALAGCRHSVILIDAANGLAKTKPDIGAQDNLETADLSINGGFEGSIVRTKGGFDLLSISKTSGTDLGQMSNRWTEAMMQKLKDRYDYIIIETTPVLSLGNAIRFLPYADTVVVASRWNATARQTVESCIQRLHDLRAPNLYVVMTDVRRRIERKYEYRGFDKTMSAGWRRS